MTITTDASTDTTTEIPVTPAVTAADVISTLRRRPRNVHLAGGFGPLLVGIVLLLLMLWAAPSVAPEHVVERPAATTTTTAVAGAHP